MLVAGIWFAFVGHTFDNTPVFEYIRGGTADWLVTNEAWNGGNPYAPLDQLAEEQLGWMNVLPTDPHPRPPSALLLLGPLALSPDEQVIRVLAVANALALGIWAITSIRWLSLRPRAEFLIIPLAFMAPSLNSAVWGSQIPIVAACLGLGLALVQRPTAWPLGIAVASGFKLFPFLAAFAGDGRQRWRVVLTAAAAFIVLTLGGLALPGVGPGEAIASIIDAPGSYSVSDANISLNNLIGWAPGSVVFPLLGVILVVGASSFMSDRGAVSMSLIAMVLFAPYAWPEYMILWFPALIYLWRLGAASRLVVLLFPVVVALTKDGRLLALAGLAVGCALVFTEARGSRRGNVNKSIESDRGSRSV